MTNAWQQAQEKADRQAEKGGMFVRLKNNGDKIVGVFCGDPYAKEVVWIGQKSEEYNPDNPEHKGVRTSLRISLNFFVPADGQMKVIEGSAQFFKGIVKVKEKYGLDNWLFEIERQGEAGDPKTKYSILPEEKVTPEVRAQIGKAQLHDLATMGGRDDEGDAGAGRSPDSGPISERDAQDIVECLKALPKADVGAFLSKFEVQRVRDMKSSQVSDARALLNELGGATFGTEVDPFA